MKYTIKKSNRAYKKYVAIFSDGKMIHFGDSRYPQYKDQTGLGVYSHLDHLDEKRKKLYYARHGKADMYTAKWFSHKYLWSI